jgi:hypothetical protein
VTYPPAGLLPLPGDSVEAAEGCDVWDDIFNNALIINPAFNIYRIWDTVSRGGSYSLPVNVLHPSIPSYGMSSAPRKSLNNALYILAHADPEVRSYSHKLRSTSTARMSSLPSTRLLTQSGRSVPTSMSSQMETVACPLPSLCYQTLSRRVSGPLSCTVSPTLF